MDAFLYRDKTSHLFRLMSKRASAPTNCLKQYSNARPANRAMSTKVHREIRKEASSLSLVRCSGVAEMLPGLCTPRDIAYEFCADFTLAAFPPYAYQIMETSFEYAAIERTRDGFDPSMRTVSVRKCT